MMKKICIVVLLLVSTVEIGFGQSFQGGWAGKLSVQKEELPLLFEFRYNGQWEGTLQSPKQSSQKFPLSTIRTKGDSIFFTVDKLEIQFSGQLVEHRTNIHGEFQQGSFKTVLILDRINGNADLTPASYKRSQRIAPPYSYDTLDVVFGNKLDNVTLAGTLTKPREAGKFPAVVLVTGSGPQDRNESMMGHEPFKVIADYLTSNGIVVLRYDDRGVGESTGSFSNATTGDFGKDALAALNFLKSDAKVDPNKIGILGHSEGGLIAYILAGQRAPSVNFLISLAGPSIKMDSLMMLQNMAVMKSLGKEMTTKDSELIRENFAIAKGDLPADQAFKAVMKNMESVPNSQNSTFADEIGVLITPWYRHFLKIDPIPFIKKINVPVFAAFGGKDIQVPAMQNMESLTDNLQPNSKNELKIYPNFNHLFQNATTGSVKEYAEIGESINERILEDMVVWIKNL